MCVAGGMELSHCHYLQPTDTAVPKVFYLWVPTYLEAHGGRLVPVPVHDAEEARGEADGQQLRPHPLPGLVWLVGLCWLCKCNKSVASSSGPPTAKVRLIVGRSVD